VRAPDGGQGGALGFSSDGTCGVGPLVLATIGGCWTRRQSVPKHGWLQRRSSLRLRGGALGRPSLAECPADVVQLVMEGLLARCPVTATALHATSKQVRRCLGEATFYVVRMWAIRQVWSRVAEPGKGGGGPTVSQHPVATTIRRHELMSWGRLSGGEDDPRHDGIESENVAVQVAEPGVGWFELSPGAFRMAATPLEIAVRGDEPCGPPDSVVREEDPPTHIRLDVAPPGCPAPYRWSMLPQGSVRCENPEDDLWATVLRLGGNSPSHHGWNFDTLQTEVKIYDGERMVTQVTSRPYAMERDAQTPGHRLSGRMAGPGYPVYVGRRGADAVCSMVDERRYGHSVQIELCVRIDGEIWSDDRRHGKVPGFVTTLVVGMQATYVNTPGLRRSGRESKRSSIQLTNPTGVEATLQTPPLTAGIATAARQLGTRSGTGHRSRSAVLLGLTQMIGMPQVRAVASGASAVWPAGTGHVGERADLGSGVALRWRSGEHRRSLAGDCMARYGDLAHLQEAGVGTWFSQVPFSPRRGSDHGLRGYNGEWRSITSGSDPCEAVTNNEDITTCSLNEGPLKPDKRVRPDNGPERRRRAMLAALVLLSLYGMLSGVRPALDIRGGRLRGVRRPGVSHAGRSTGKQGSVASGMGLGVYFEQVCVRRTEPLGREDRLLAPPEGGAYSTCPHPRMCLFRSTSPTGRAHSTSLHNRMVPPWEHLLE
jgi:hypothetical protein